MFDFKNTFAEKIGKKYWRFLLKLLLVFCKNIEHNIGFLRKTPIFSPIIGKNLRKV
jgi:hypothetical protein